MARIDHIVFAAQTLEKGADYAQQILGVRPAPGGKHPLMGTHNLLLNLGNRVYLEVIAIDPEAPNPGRPRWFDLDHLDLSEPRLITWVAHTRHIESVPADFGKVTKASRGNLEWLIAIPEDGRLHEGGVIPYLIQWGEAHPTDNRTDSGCELVELVGFHPEPERVLKMLERLGLSGALRVEKADEVSLEAHIQTSAGPRILQ